MGNMARRGSFFVAVLCAIALLSSCGGGGGGGGAPGASPATSVQTGTATGTVIDGPISGATVDVYDFTGNTRGLKLGTGTTDANGNYSVTLTPRPTGPVIIVASGGTYTEDATGALTTLGASDQFTEIVSASSIVSGTLTAHVNPLSHIASSLVQAASGTINLDNAITMAKGVLGQQYGISVTDLSSNVPVSASNPSISAPPSMNQRQGGIVLAGISKLAESMGVRTVDLIKALADDYSDGKFDGKKGSVSITVPKIAGGPPATLTANTAVTDLQTSMTSFLASAQNKSGLTTPPPVNPQPLQAVNLSLNTAGLVFVKTDVLPAFTTGVTSSVNLQATGGTPPYNWTNLTNCPTAAVSSAGVLTATGATLGAGSSIAFSNPCEVTVTDTRGQQAKFSFRITTVAAAPTINTVAAQMTTGVAGQVVVATASGGTPPYFFYKGTGQFPPLGTSVITSADHSSGLVSGKPTTAGTYTFDVCVADLSRTEKCKSTTVTVVDPPKANVTVTSAGTGTGSVTPAGVDSTGAAVAGTPCTGGVIGCTSYPFGTKVTLSAVAASGSTFDGWSGAGCTGTGTCIITLNANTSVTATFTKTATNSGGSLTGTWVGTWSKPSGNFCDFQTYSINFVLTQTGNTVTGTHRSQVTAKDQFGICPDSVGFVENQTIAIGTVTGSSFTLTMTGGRSFTGTINGTTLTGTGGTSFGRGNFSVTKQ
jgi:hypothetical protein